MKSKKIVIGLTGSKGVIGKYFQKQYHINPTFSISVTNPGHAPSYTAEVFNISNTIILGKGIGHTKKEAEINASASALNVLQKNLR